VEYLTNCISKATFSFALQSKDEHTSEFIKGYQG